MSGTQESIESSLGESVQSKSSDIVIEPNMQAPRVSTEEEPELEEFIAMAEMKDGTRKPFSELKEGDVIKINPGIMFAKEKFAKRKVKKGVVVEKLRFTKTGKKIEAPEQAFETEPEVVQEKDVNFVEIDVEFNVPIKGKKYPKKTVMVPARPGDSLQTLRKRAAQMAQITDSEQLREFIEEIQFEAPVKEGKLVMRGDKTLAVVGPMGMLFPYTSETKLQFLEPSLIKRLSPKPKRKIGQAKRKFLQLEQLPEIQDVLKETLTKDSVAREIAKVNLVDVFGGKPETSAPATAFIESKLPAPRRPFSLDILLKDKLPKGPYAYDSLTYKQYLRREFENYLKKNLDISDLYNENEMEKICNYGKKKFATWLYDIIYGERNPMDATKDVDQNFVQQTVTNQLLSRPMPKDKIILFLSRRFPSPKESMKRLSGGKLPKEEILQKRAKLEQKLQKRVVEKDDERIEKRLEKLRKMEESKKKAPKSASVDLEDLFAEQLEQEMEEEEETRKRAKHWRQGIEKIMHDLKKKYEIKNNLAEFMKKIESEAIHIGEIQNPESFLQGTLKRFRIEQEGKTIDVPGVGKVEIPEELEIYEDFPLEPTAFMIYTKKGEQKIARGMKDVDQVLLSDFMKEAPKNIQLKDQIAMDLRTYVYGGKYEKFKEWKEMMDGLSKIYTFYEGPTYTEEFSKKQKGRKSQYVGKKNGKYIYELTGFYEQLRNTESPGYIEKILINRYTKPSGNKASEKIIATVGAIVADIINMTPKEVAEATYPLDYVEPESTKDMLKLFSEECKKYTQLYKDILKEKRFEQKNRDREFQMFKQRYRDLLKQEHDETKMKPNDKFEELRKIWAKEDEKIKEKYDEYAEGMRGDGLTPITFGEYKINRFEKWRESFVRKHKEKEEKYGDVVNLMEKSLYNEYKNQPTERYLFHLAKMLIFLGTNEISENAKIFTSKLKSAKIDMNSLAKQDITELLPELKLNTVPAVLKSLKVELSENLPKNPTDLKNKLDRINRLVVFLKNAEINKESKKLVGDLEKSLHKLEKEAEQSQWLPSEIREKFGKMKKLAKEIENSNTDFNLDKKTTIQQLDRIISDIEEKKVRLAFQILYKLNPSRKVPTRSVTISGKFHTIDPRDVCGDNIAYSDLIVCQDKGQYYCLSESALLSEMAQGNTPINPYTKKPIPKELVNKLKKRL